MWLHFLTADRVSFLVNTIKFQKFLCPLFHSNFRKDITLRAWLHGQTGSQCQKLGNLVKHNIINFWDCTTTKQAQLAGILGNQAGYFQCHQACQARLANQILCITNMAAPGRPNSCKITLKLSQESQPCSSIFSRTS